MKKSFTFLLLILIVSCAQPAEETADPKPSNTELVQGMYDAFAEGNVEAVLAVFSDSIVWNEAEGFIYADGNPYVGPQAIVEGVFARLGQEWEYWNLENITLQSLDDDGVLATGRYKAKNRTTAKELDAQFAHVWKFQDGKATSFQQYTDTKQSVEAITPDSEEE